MKNREFAKMRNCSFDEKGKFMTSDKVLSGYKEISAFLGVSLRTLRRYSKSIPLSQFGQTKVILEADLVEWIKKNYKTAFKGKKGF